jgi:hypothetical protein
MASMNQSIEVDMSDAAKQCLLTITVKGKARFWFRMWLMTRLLILAKWVAPIPVEIEDEP